MLSFLFGSRGLRPDLPSPFGRKFLFCLLGGWEIGNVWGPLGASLHSEALSHEYGRECPGTGDCGPTRHVGAGRWGLLLADCSRVARATTPGPPPQPHGWVRLRFEVSKFPDFWRGGRHVPTSLGVWSFGAL